MSDENLLSIQEVTDILNVPAQSIYEWIEKGTLRTVSVDGELCFHPREIQALFETKDSESARQKRSILVIDDDPLVGESLKILLGRAGYMAGMVPIGLAALDRISREVFDLILTDIRMPGMNGLETLKAIREVQSHCGKPQVPEIVMTAYDDPGVREEAERMGVREFILKPFEIQDLLGTLEKNLAKGVLS